MPASTLDPVNAAIRNSLSKTASETNLDIQLAGATKKALLADIEFEAAGSYQSTVLDKLKTKYIVLKSSEPQQISNTEKMGADETLTLAKHELYPLEAVQLGWSNTEWVVGAGMVNMGNTCYLNSTLQALFHVPALVNWLVSDKQHMSQCEDSGGLCIICAMRKTLQDSQQRNTNSIRPFLIYNKLRVVCRNLIPGRQEDAHEFLRYLVEAMEKAYLSRFKNHSEFDSRTKETTPLNQILGGYLRSAVRCLECGHVSTTFQHFQDLLLDIRKAQTLEEALDGYFSREKLDDESYHCESCQKKVPATKQFSLERAPMVLCIQLKRFSVSNNKITKHVQFRQRLELTKYARHRPSVPLVYRFVALVTHMGPTVGCGHYTAVAQAPCGNYYQFDDSMVRPISHQAVFNTNAYIMLYELECPPFAQKMQNNGTTTKMKTTTLLNNTCSSSNSSHSSSSTASCSVIQKDSDYEIKSATSNKVQMNGSRMIYGPELPPKLEITMTVPTATTTTTTTTTTVMMTATLTTTTTTNQNGVISSSSSGKIGSSNRKINGNSSNRESLSSSSESDTEQQQEPSNNNLLQQNNNDSIAAAIESTISEVIQKCKSPKTRCRTPQCVNSNTCSPTRSCSSSSVSSLSSSKDGGDSPTTPDSLTVAPNITIVTATTTTSTMTTQSVTKLVPYDVDEDDDDEEDDDENNEEDEESSTSSSCSSVESETIANPNQRANATTIDAAAGCSSNTRIPTKAMMGDWQVTSSIDHNAHEPSSKGKSWDKKSKTNFQKEEKCTAGINAVNELLKMSHVGYSAPVSSWNGSRASLDKEINEERREDRKRSMCDNSDQGRVKHLKSNSSTGGGYKSNPGYNRLQEFHNIKNSWNQNNNNGSSSSSYGSRQFYNTSGKHRNRRNNFHHKNNYHKNNYTFRQ